MKSIVVTGGCGFIGSHIVEEAVKLELKITVIDNLHSGFLGNIKHYIDAGKVNFIKASIMDFDVLKDAFNGVDSIFHLGALISVPESMEKKSEYVEINTIGTLNVLEAAKVNNVKNVVLSSSAAIYGDNPVVPKVESMLPEPKSPYAVSKLDGEYYLRLYRNEYGINATSLRYFNVFGTRQDPASQYAAAIPIFVSKAIKNEDITIFGDGEQTRDFVYVKDVVQANFLAAKIGGDVFNVAYGKTITIKDIAKKVIDIIHSSSKIVYVKERLGDIKHSKADITAITSELGFIPTSDLDNGLKNTVEYFVKKMNG